MQIPIKLLIARNMVVATAFLWSELHTYMTVLFPLLLLSCRREVAAGEADATRSPS